MLTAILDADLASITIGEGFGSYVFATGEGFFHPHENKELAGRLSWAIWDANHGYCVIEIREACVEIRPQHTYRRNRSDSVTAYIGLKSSGSREKSKFPNISGRSQHIGNNLPFLNLSKIP